MEKNHNPNTWSELPLDLLNLVFKRLSLVNFQRAKSVCSTRYSVSRQCVPERQIALLILFPKEDNTDNSTCKLFNPDEKDKLYKMQDLGVEFAKSVCRATYGSWLLMQDSKYHLYILNIFTRKRINLPPVESQLGMVKIERTIYDWFHFSHGHYSFSLSSPVFWIDEESKDYIVMWGLGVYCVVYAKKGDTSWNQIPQTSYFYDMVYKDHKLYFLSSTGTFQILDFSEEMDNKTSKVVCLLDRKLVVTVTGKALKVAKMWRPTYRTWSFRVFKISSSGYEKLDSLGDEALLLDLGITVLASDVEGFKRNSIYFSCRPSGGYETNASDLFLFNLETQKMELLHKFDCSSLQLYRSRWFLPSLTHT
ncbi:unnamed protein product [Arabidopsis thaliana]|uniref:Probable F-box protein At4g22165 n=2 Tax=Arabidopsis thaliana TaxID=3702 RepID=FB347_ARATH|nr:F-box protein (DUF295) [Arabidopsis thaliana]P0CG94.1 RecName: Full=Probable F-box protein At4g22165 [Arabidopsis thaliana]AEE84567.1 F-box protein (DUF295) [Arabidopsis thaliana]CAD5328690.1 unnamed protein product [Arabidopsis thaliana]|eukprot:NP_567647.1 F-box protein (DUF295) [Arabidopsis thaliana]